MKSTLELVENVERRKWYKNQYIWIIIAITLLVLIIIILTTIFLLKNKLEKNNPIHIHYTRVNTKVYSGGYELYQLNVLPQRNPAQQYKLFGDFLRVSLFNKSNYEQFLPSCPIIFALSSVDHPEEWRAMLFGTMKYPSPNMPYPYICFLSVLRDHRQYRLGSILLNRFINEMFKSTTPPVTHIQLHTNWENCRAQKLYNRCGFQCNQFTANGYSKPFEPQYKFGHMIRMELDMHNIRNRSEVCLSSDAVQISPQDMTNYETLCQQNIPNGTNRTCSKF
ncbi:unnamed protein product [Adineta steineri]|uniref:N-acetyltransferase domain-containing protein n=1 Tax=Adineta steineri TaxID=433720 RepID=A0A818J2Q9_9BILA|nr:unnamed protein product [Adineta steineri]